MRSQFVPHLSGGAVEQSQLTEALPREHVADLHVILDHIALTTFQEIKVITGRSLPVIAELDTVVTVQICVICQVPNDDLSGHSEQRLHAVHYGLQVL